MRKREYKTECVLAKHYWYVPGPRKDHYCDIIVCRVAAPAMDFASDTLAVGRAMREHVVAFNPVKVTAPEFIYLSLGMDPDVNLWLNSAIQVSQSVAQDCIVCMHARPRLHPIDAIQTNVTCSRTSIAYTSDKWRV